jgi:hypothetical protein
MPCLAVAHEFGMLMIRPAQRPTRQPHCQPWEVLSGRRGGLLGWYQDGGFRQPRTSGRFVQPKIAGWSNRRLVNEPTFEMQCPVFSRPHFSFGLESI